MTSPRGDIIANLLIYYLLIVHALAFVGAWFVFWG